MNCTLIPLFAAPIFAGTARSQNPDQPRPDGAEIDRLKHEVEELRRAGKTEEAEARKRKPDGAQEVHREKSKSEPNPEGKPEPKAEFRKSPPNPRPARPDAPVQARRDGPFAGGPIAERLKGRIEALRREGKGEQAEQFAKRAREMWEKRRGGLAGGDRGKSHGEKPAPKSDERAAHLAEAAKHLNAAGIHVSPEMLEKFGQKSSGKPERRPLFSHRLERPAGSPGHHPAPPQANRAPGAGPSSDAVQNEIHALAKQVQELRAMIQEQRGGAPDAAPMPQGGGGAFQRPHFRAPQAAPGGPGANREHSGFPQRNPGENRGDNHPRSEGRPSNPPGNPAIPGDRPRGDAPQP